MITAMEIKMRRKRSKSLVKFVKSAAVFGENGFEFGWIGDAHIEKNFKEKSGSLSIIHSAGQRANRPIRSVHESGRSEAREHHL